MNKNEEKQGIIEKQRLHDYIAERTEALKEKFNDSLESRDYAASEWCQRCLNELGKLAYKFGVDDGIDFNN